MAERSMTRAMPSLRLTASRPEIQSARGLVVFLRFLLVLAFEIFVIFIAGLFAVAVVRLIVEDEDVFHPHQFGHHALDHLAFGLGVSISSPCGPGAARVRLWKSPSARGA